MSTLDQVYDPKREETSVYKLWEKGNAFNADPGPHDNSYCIVIPPPNVTAALHLGHALNNAIQDTLIRYHRMKGLNTLWMPGTDHAGIATQTVVEKRILSEEGKRRTDFERDEFIGRVQAWKDEYEATILGQLRAMGASCDWRRTRFTMDEVCARAVRENFFKLFADGLIYRGKRLVNWDPATQTVLADDEVEHEEINGHFWYLRYPLEKPVTVDGETVDHVTVATTRPETMLGDTAVAMHPHDPRAAALVGQSVRLPLVNRLIPIVADEHVVMANPESDDEKARFSTGFLKVTPAHDPDDYQIGLRHDLEMINVMAPDGSISIKHGWTDAEGTEAEAMAGLDRFVARKRIVAWFKEHDLLESTRDYTHQVGHSYRSHVPIEPYLSDQWYVAVKRPVDSLPGEGLIEGTDVPRNSLAGAALTPLLEGKVRFVPERYATTYRAWVENLRDWPISRQLWWGHRIPVWSHDLALPSGKALAPDEVLSGEEAVTLVNDALGLELGSKFGEFGERFTVQVGADPEDPAKARAFLNVGQENQEAEGWLEASGWVQDNDVLDTWFSSALWPFSTLGWPEKTPELATFYPGNVLCTAREIITLWVSRMVMMGQYCVGDIPFTDVFIHAMIQDGEGRKMSKSLGNGIDPLEVIDTHGADAMRFTLISMTTQTQDVRMPVEPLTLPDGRAVNTSPKFTLGRNFCNKLWNASRFVMMNLEDTPEWDSIDPTAELADRWLLSRLTTTVNEVTDALERYRFNDVADRIYHFTWSDFCDWYLEIAKARIQAGEAGAKTMLAFALDTILRLLHPVSPFITEAIWQRLNEAVPARGPRGTGEPLLLRAAWPEPNPSWADVQAEKDFAVVQDLVREVRNLRTHHNVPPSTQVEVVLEISGESARVAEANKLLVRTQSRASKVTVTQESPADLKGAATATVPGGRLHVLDVVDVEAEKERLSKQKEKLEKAIQGTEGKLSNEKFVSRAPEKVVAQERERLEEARRELAEVTRLLGDLG